MDEDNSSHLCSLVDSNDGNDYSSGRKRLRKKGNVSTERTDESNAGPCVCLTHSESEKKCRRGRRHREDVQEIEHPVSTPQQKKHKKNKSATDSTSLNILTRTSKSGEETGGRNTVDGAVVSGLGTDVCLTHTKRSMMKHRSKTLKPRSLPRKPSASG